MAPARLGQHSEANEWRTPGWLFQGLARRIPFTLDLWARPDNSLCSRSHAAYRRPGDVAWGNPPYGLMLDPLLEEFRVLMHAGELRAAALLLPVRTSTEWWRRVASLAGQTVFIRGRLRFSGAGWNAPFDSVLLLYGDLPPLDSVTALRGKEAVRFADE